MDALTLKELYNLRTELEAERKRLVNLLLGPIRTFIPDSDIRPQLAQLDRELTDIKQAIRSKRPLQR